MSDGMAYLTFKYHRPDAFIILRNVARRVAETMADREHWSAISSNDITMIAMRMIDNGFADMYDNDLAKAIDNDTWL